MDSILFRESIEEIVLVFPNPLLKIARHTDVNCAVSLVRDYVDGWLLYHLINLESRFRGNDGLGVA